MKGLKLIASAGADWGIGRDGALLFRIPEDLRRFRALTEGALVIMGRCTLESLPGGRPLQNRINVVLSRRRGLRIDGAEVCASREELEAVLAAYPDRTAFVIGGEAVYRLLLDACDTAYITKIGAAAPADRYLPDFDQAPAWRLVSREEHLSQTGLPFAYCEYRRR